MDNGIMPLFVCGQYYCRSPLLRTDLSIMWSFACAGPAHRKYQAVRINVLGNSDTKRFRRLLHARHIVFGHPLVKLIKIRNLKTSTALSCLLCSLSLSIRRANIAFVQSQCCSFNLARQSTPWWWSTKPR